VGEQEGREGAEEILVALVEGVAKRLDARGGIAAVGDLLGDDPVEPARILGDEQPGDAGAGESEQDGDESLLPQALDRLGPVPGEESAELAPRRGANPVDLEIGPDRELLEIVDEGSVERGVAGDGERGEGGAVEARKREQVVVRKAVQRPLLDALEDLVEALPVGGVGGPEAARVDERRRGGRVEQSGGVGVHSRFRLLRSK
jgi:hypothetical protein